MSYNFNLLNERGMKRPCLFNTDTVSFFSYCEGYTVCTTLNLLNCSFENLYSFTVSFFDLSVYLNCIASVELRCVCV